MYSIVDAIFNEVLLTLRFVVFHKNMRDIKATARDEDLAATTEMSGLSDHFLRCPISAFPHHRLRGVLIHRNQATIMSSHVKMISQALNTLAIRVRAYISIG
jgi:hypothetical protein